MKSKCGAIDNAFMYETIISYRLSSYNDRSSPIIDLLSGEGDADEKGKCMGGERELQGTRMKREFIGAGRKEYGRLNGNPESDEGY